MACPACGAQTDPAQPYCLNCGYELYSGGGNGYADPWQQRPASAPPASAPPGAWGQGAWGEQEQYQGAATGYQQGYYEQSGYAGGGYDQGYQQPSYGGGGYDQGGYQGGGYQDYAGQGGYAEPPPPRGDRYRDRYDEEYDEDYDDEPGARWPSWLLAGLLVVILVVGGLYVAKRTGFIGGSANNNTNTQPSDHPSSSTSASSSSTPGPSATTAKQQAEAIDSLLTESAKSRSALAPALSSISACSGVNDAVDTIDQVTTERQAQVDKAKTLAVSELPEGDALQTKLVQMLTDSWHADQAYGQWAKAVQTDGCGSGGSFRSQGDSISGSAQANKGAFLSQWNPIATAQGLPTRSKSEI